MQKESEELVVSSEECQTSEEKVVRPSFIHPLTPPFFTPKPILQKTKPIVVKIISNLKKIISNHF